MGDDSGALWMKWSRKDDKEKLLDTFWAKGQKFWWELYMARYLYFLLMKLLLMKEFLLSSLFSMISGRNVKVRRIRRWMAKLQPVVVCIFLLMTCHRLFFDPLMWILFLRLNTSGGPDSSTAHYDVPAAICDEQCCRRWVWLSVQGGCHWGLRRGQDLCCAAFQIRKLRGASWQYNWGWLLYEITPCEWEES